MRKYFSQGGFASSAPSYYTYGIVPPEIWPIANVPPLTQAQQDYDDELLGGSEEGFAYGGIAEGGPLSVLSGGGMAPPKAEGSVAGPGTGRSDEIDARLSDGEYVMDAETVALLGDGSTAAGARLLDEMRENIRKHKGAALAKGKFSPSARAPLDYLAGED